MRSSENVTQFTDLFVDGPRHCFFLPRAAFNPTLQQMHALILCWVNPNSHLEKQENFDFVQPDGRLPQHGDPVRVQDTTLGKTYEGEVIPMPEGHVEAKKFNVAMLVTTPETGGFVIAAEWREMKLRFGHLGKATSLIKRYINGLMTENPAFSFTPNMKLRRLVLAQDPSEFDRPDLPSPSSELRALVDKICTKFTLNEAQRKAVEAVWFYHSFVLISGPPETGKSRIAPALLEIAENLRSKYVFCTGTNQALDVVRSRKGAGQHVRIYTQSEEGSFNEGPSDIVFNTAALPAVPRHSYETTDDPSPSTQLPAMSQQASAMLGSLFQPHFRGTPLKASLEAFIRIRHDQLDVRQPELFPGEATQIRQVFQLRNAIGQAGILDMELGVRDEEMKATTRLKQTYTKGMLGVFATVKGLAIPVVKTRRGADLIVVDEGTRIGEAEGVFPFARFYKANSRMVILGDPQERPPFCVAPDNIFHHQGKLSLFERLQKAGMKVFTLDVQYKT